MSQHRFPAKLSSGRAVEVLIGYDRPLHGFYLVVTTDYSDPVDSADAIDAEDDDEYDGCDHFVYSNLDDIGLIDLNGYTLDLGYFKSKLSMLGIALPRPIEEELQADRVARTGNRECLYDAAGNALTGEGV
jgi:hypothetical protein